MDELVQNVRNEIGEDMMGKLLKGTLAISSSEEKLNWLLEFVTAISS